MAKKKKSKRDARGYGQPVKKQAAVPGKGKEVQVSRSTQEEIVKIIDDLKITLEHERLDPVERQKRQIEFNIHDLKMAKKIEHLNGELTRLGFTKEQIVKAFSSIISGDYVYPRPMEDVNPLSLTHILDWMCMHVSTEELPKLFTDQVDDVSGSVSIEKPIKVESSADEGTTVMEEKIVTEPWKQFKTDDAVKKDIQKEKEDEELKKRMLLQQYQYEEYDEEDGEDIEEVSDAPVQSEDKDEFKRKLLLQQYQYDDEEEEEDNEFADIMSENSSKKESAKIEPKQAAEKSVNEIRLEKLEIQIKEDKETLNDDVANYMRSKHEIAEIKKRLKKNEGVAKGVRGKIAKQKAKEAEEAALAEPMIEENTKEKEEDEEDYGGGMFDLFNAPAPVASTAASEDAKPPVTTSKQDLVANIPVGWSGKLPKDVFLEQCRKKKIPKPKFTKMPGSRNGCSIIMKVKNEEMVVNHEGPFAKYKDAEHFAATKALYEIDPSLPLYRLLPPTFKDLWKSWLDEEQKSKDIESSLAQNERERQTQSLLQQIQDSLPDDISEPPSKALDVEEEKEEVTDWDDEESWGSDEEEKNENASPSIYGSTITEDGKRLQKFFKRKQQDDSYKEMLAVRVNLPMHAYRDKILDVVEKHPVTVLCAETGAGKTTQCPQFILEDALERGYGDKVNIVVTQPRRISAISVADRTSEELDDAPVGGLVGYSIRMETKRSKRTKLMFCTTGVILRRLVDDPNLKGISHVVVDEVHERQWQIDFLLIALRRLLHTTRKDLKVILMSATLDAELFCKFFNGAPFFKIEGRTYPVNDYYLENIFEATSHVIEEDSRYALRNLREGNTTSMWVTTKGGEKKRTIVDLESQLDSLHVSDEYAQYSMPTRRSMEIVNEEVINFELIEDLLSLLLVNTHENTMLVSPSSNCDGLSNGSVLVFLPGIGEIRELHDLLKSNPYFGDENRFIIIPMHSTIFSKQNYKRAFATPKRGCRKIVLATNICETSVTIADCICVIDTGLERQVVQSKSTSTLKTMWCSRASAKQRAGRAGRVQAGICCKLYSSKTANYTMKKQSAPELMRVPLEEVCLSILAGNLSDNCMDFLLQAPQPPTNEAVQSALKVLEEVGAIEPFATKKSAKRQEKLTALGRHLAKLPVHVRLGKMLLYGSIFGVLDSILTVVSFLNCSKSPFVTNLDNSSHISAVQNSLKHHSSDFLTACRVWEAYNKALEVSPSNARKFIKGNFLNRTSLLEIGENRKQFFQLIASIGFVDAKVKSLADLSSMSSSCNRNKLKEEIVDAAITSGLYPNIAHASKDVSGEITLYSKADKVHFHKSSTNYKKKLSTEWIVYQEKFATSRTWVSTTATIQPFSLLIFGQNLHVKHTEQKVIIDDWIEVGIQAQNAVMIREMKYSLQKEVELLISEETKQNDDSTKIINGICRLLSLATQL
ncbi:hypothetical protein CTEN210_13442 [Chaetoceros tenuissimus]|uniref:RNA helicase n=1 Tax=Chaetoceros tenuissimus TaxID=426638 RepID=A0AAD3D348_9STRA|nr:hypothetical protein CTEN210_13442 [Chaetoceros tenuissimus]